MRTEYIRNKNYIIRKNLVQTSSLLSSLSIFFVTIINIRSTYFEPYILTPKYKNGKIIDIIHLPSPYALIPVVDLASFALVIMFEVILKHFYKEDDLNSDFNFIFIAEFILFALGVAFFVVSTIFHY